MTMDGPCEGQERKDRRVLGPLQQQRGESDADQLQFVQLPQEPPQVQPT